MFACRPRRWVFVVVVGSLASCQSTPSGSGAAEDLAEQALTEAIAVSSPAFVDGAPIPRAFSCDGDDVSPPLSWAGVPDDAVEVALVVDDPDAPGGTYVHWVLFGLDPSIAGLGEHETPGGAREAENSAGDAGYKGPCPPSGDDAHHYRFTVYALDEEIRADDESPASDVLATVSETAIAKGTLTGTFDR